MKKKQAQRNKMIAAAASVCIILGASTTAYATNMFGLKDMVMSKTASEAYMTHPSDSPHDTISTQGFGDTNEKKALDEWLSFIATYDKDGALLDKVGNGPTGLDPKYDAYNVYTQDMADKLDEITKKYNLTLQSPADASITTEELIQKVGTGNFLGTVNFNEGAWMYEDGSFHIDGYAKLDSRLKINYQFMNTKKGVFDSGSLSIGNIKDYDEWDYTTACGLNVHLAIGPDKSLIMADLGDSFITINVLAGTAHGFLDEQGKYKITSTNLEQLADSFDFSLIKSQAASSMVNNKSGKKVFTREGSIGEFMTLLSKQPEISEIYTFIKDNAKDAKKEEVTEMLCFMEDFMGTISSSFYEKVNAPEIKDALAKAYNAKIDYNQPDQLDDPKLKALVEKAKAAGIVIGQWYTEKFGTEYYASIDYTKLKELYANATEDMIEYVDMQILEDTHPYDNDNGLAIGWDELINRAISAGEFLKKYESSDRADNVKDMYKEYQKRIFGTAVDSMIISPFDEKTKVLKDDVKKVFETSISRNPNAEFAKKLQKFLDIVSKNDNKLTKEVQDFIELEIHGKIWVQKKKALQLEMQKSK